MGTSATLRSHSPISLVGNVKTPTMVMVGEEDHRTPPSEAEQFYQGLQVAKVPTILVRVPGASHGGLADRPSQLAAENATDHELTARCEDSKPRCERAKTRVAAPCG